jgi:hypothetical protein
MSSLVFDGGGPVNWFGRPINRPYWRFVDNFRWTGVDLGDLWVGGGGGGGVRCLGSWEHRGAWGTKEQG